MAATGSEQAAGVQDFGQTATPGHPVVMVPPPVVVPPPLVTRAHAPIPANDPASWIGTQDYPPAALRNGETGSTGFALGVDVQGQVTACEITASSGSSVLDQATCQLLTQRARFIPAADVAGAKVAGRYASRIRWVLPTTPPLPQAGTRAARYVIEADGSRSHCEQAVGGGVWLERPCPPHTVGAAFQGKDGQPVRRRVTITMTTKVDDVAN